MLKQFKAFSFTFEKVPLELRESIALEEDGAKELLEYLKEFTDEALVLSTCHRTEIFYSTSQELSSEIIKWFGIEKGKANPDLLQKNCLLTEKHEEAVRRLFEISAVCAHFLRIFGWR